MCCMFDVNLVSRHGLRGPSKEACHGEMAYQLLTQLHA